MKALDELRSLKLAEIKRNHPNVPEHALPTPKYTDKTANGLEICIVDYINLIGGIAERRGSMGRYLKPKTYQNIFGKTVELGKGKYIPTTGRKGTPDLTGVYKGAPLAVEVKIGRDRLSKAQKAYKAQFETAGGWYCIARDFQGFYDEFLENMENGK